MTPQDKVLVLGHSLQRLIEEKGWSAREASAALGYNPAYLSRALRGVHPLRVEVVFELIARLGHHPHEVFSQLFPLGGDTVLRLEAVLGDNPADDEAARVVRQLAAKQRGAPLSPREYRLRLAELLAAALRDAEVSQRSVSRSLGRRNGALGEALRGNSHLSFLQVFTVLESARTDPGRVFFELFLRRPDDMLRRLRQARSVQLLEAALRRSTFGQLAAQAALEAAAEATPPPLPPTARPARRPSAPRAAVEPGARSRPRKPARRAPRR